MEAIQGTDIHPSRVRAVAAVAVMVNGVIAGCAFVLAWVLRSEVDGIGGSR